MKEKCTSDAGRHSCDRCLALDRECTRNRTIQKAGRKRRPRIALNSASPPIYEDFGTAAGLELSKSNNIYASQVEPELESEALAPFEVELLRLLRSERTEDLNAFVKLLVIGPNFERELGAEIRAMAEWKFEGGLDGYLACMGALGLHLGIIKDGDANSNIRRGTLAVSKLRACPKPTLDDLENWIVFGLAIITFSMTALGTGATTVRRHVLLHVASMPNIPDHLMTSDSLLCLTAFEIWECLMKRSSPVFKLDLLQSIRVSRLFGVCGGIFSFLYDICELSHALPLADEVERESIIQNLIEIEEQIESWHPYSPQLCCI